MCLPGSKSWTQYLHIFLFSCNPSVVMLAHTWLWYGWKLLVASGTTDSRTARWLSGHMAAPAIEFMDSSYKADTIIFELSPRPQINIFDWKAILPITKIKSWSI